MPYTLTKGLVWVLLAVLLGVLIGWLLRSVAAKRQVERARSANLGTAEQQELERLRNRVANLEPVVTERDRLSAELDEERRRSKPAAEAEPAPVTETGDGTPEPVQADGASEVLGRPVALDDLTVIDGIGPQVADLCHGIGIRTWSDLAATEVSLLRTMLNDAGQRFKSLDPSAWPHQAGLLATGSWAEFAALGDDGDGGRPVG